MRVEVEEEVEGRWGLRREEGEKRGKPVATAQLFQQKLSNGWEFLNVEQ